MSEKYVNIGGAAYEFVVDPHGDSLTLTPSPEHRGVHAALTVGSMAPDFTFKGLDGRSRTLSEYRGKVVLLDFWSTTCGPCVGEAPKLVDSYSKYRPLGFEILGIDDGETRDKVAEFLAAHKIGWEQALEADDGPIQTLYRIIGLPS